MSDVIELLYTINQRVRLQTAALTVKTCPGSTVMILMRVLINSFRSPSVKARTVALLAQYICIRLSTRSVGPADQINVRRTTTVTYRSANIRLSPRDTS